MAAHSQDVSSALVGKKKGEWHRRHIEDNMQDRLFNEEMNLLQEQGEQHLFDLLREKYCPTESCYFEILGIKFFERKSRYLFRIRLVHRLIYIYRSYHC